MPDKPELTIPIRLDAGKALGTLKDFEKAMKKTGDTGESTAEQLRKPMASVETQALALVKHFGAMATGLGALSVGKQVLDTINEGVRNAANEMERMTKQYVDFRKKAAEAAGTQGKAPSNAFTLQQIDLADQAKVSPTDFLKFQSSMNEQIAGNIGEGRQLTQEQADTITQKAAQFGTARGISADAIATLIGGLTRQTKGGANADTEILDKFGKLINLMDASPGKVEKLLPELNEVMANGTDFEQAGQIISTMAARGRPGESGTYGRALQRSISQLMVDAKSGDRDSLGVTMEMSDTDAAKTIFDTMSKAGIDTGNQRAVNGWLAEKGFKAAEERDALTAMFNLGIKGGGIENARETIAKGGVGAIDESIDRWNMTETGHDYQADASTESAQLRRGMTESRLSLERKKAEAQLTKEGALDQYTRYEMFQDMVPDFITGDMGTTKQRKINNRVAVNLNARRDIMGGDSTGIAYTSENATVGQARDEQVKMLQALDRLVEHNAVTAEAAKQGMNRPITAPPPRSDGFRQ